MKKYIVQFLISITICFAFGFVIISNKAYALPPSYDQNFARHLLGTPEKDTQCEDMKKQITKRDLELAVTLAKEAKDDLWRRINEKKTEKEQYERQKGLIDCATQTIKNQGKENIDIQCQDMSKKITNREIELGVTFNGSARQDLKDRIGALKKERDIYQEAKGLNGCSSKELQTLWNLGFNKNKSLMENVRMFFYPDITGNGGFLREFLRMVGFLVLIVMLIRTGINIFMKSDDGGAALKEAQNIIYVVLGAGILFGATWILGVALKLGNTGGTTILVANLQNNVLFQILTFLKAMAFFVAIIMIVYYGFRVIQGSDSEEKFKEARTGILNIVMALVFIKIIDYIFFIAQQTDFKSRAVALIVQVSRIMLYILGFLFVVMLLYAGIRMMTSNGDENQFKEAQNSIFNIFLITLVIFLFLLIIYQVFAEFV